MRIKTFIVLEYDRAAQGTTYARNPVGGLR